MNSLGHNYAPVNQLGEIRKALLSGNRRADEIFASAIAQYNIIIQNLEEGMTANLICYIGGIPFDIHRVSGRGHFYEIHAKDGDGNLHMLTAPAEVATFDIIVSKKTDDTPPREIGFKMEEISSKG